MKQRSALPWVEIRALPADLCDRETARSARELREERIRAGLVPVPAIRDPALLWCGHPKDAIRKDRDFEWCVMCGETRVEDGVMEYVEPDDIGGLSDPSDDSP
jgi:hypothetical protein